MNKSYYLNAEVQLKRKLDIKIHKLKLNNIKKNPGKWSILINNFNIKLRNNLRNRNLKKSKFIIKKRKINELKSNNTRLANKLNKIKFNKTLNFKESGFYINFKKIKLKNNKILKEKRNIVLKKENFLINKYIQNSKREINNKEFYKFFMQNNKLKNKISKFKKPYYCKINKSK